MIVLTVQPPAFPLGQLAATSGALRALEEAGQCLEAFLIRHACGDWGDLCDADRQENARAARRRPPDVQLYPEKRAKSLDHHRGGLQRDYAAAPPGILTRNRRAGPDGRSGPPRGRAILRFPPGRKCSMLPGA
jgi:hypothetical protein